MENKRLSMLLAVVSSTVLFLLVSGVGPVVLWDLYLIAGLAAVLAIASCVIYPQIRAAIIVCSAALYPYFLSHCSDVLQSGSDSAALGSLAAGFPCLFPPQGGIVSMLLVGVPGTLSYALPLAVLSYLGASQIVNRFLDREYAHSHYQ